MKGPFLTLWVAIAAILGCAVTGCVTNHHGTDLSSLDQTPIVKGQTTEKDMIARFGEPQSQSTRSDGKKNLIWSDASSNAPFMGFG